MFFEVQLNWLLYHYNYTSKLKKIQLVGPDLEVVSPFLRWHTLLALAANLITSTCKKQFCNDLINKETVMQPAIIIHLFSWSTVYPGPRPPCRVMMRCLREHLNCQSKLKIFSVNIHHICQPKCLSEILQFAKFFSRWPVLTNLHEVCNV